MYEKLQQFRDPEPRRIKKFRILLVGNFSGKPESSRRSFKAKPISIDRDNFDEVLTKFEVSIPFCGETVFFRELEDFHPDRLFVNVSGFQQLEGLLQNQKVSVTRPGTSLLDQMLAEESQAEAPVTAGDAQDLAGFVKRSLHGNPTRKMEQVSASIADQRQAIASELMRSLLHDPQFQALEAGWRALSLLVYQLDPDSGLELHLLDATLSEVVAHSGVIGETLSGLGEWSVIAANYVFGQSALDIEVLRRAGKLAGSLNAVFLAESQPPGVSISEVAWDEFRHLQEARSVGLALPRFLLRLPYGKKTSEIESFSFEEMPESRHSAYLWGNPCFACALLLGKTFLAAGWKMSPLQRHLNRLPLHVYQENGDITAKPCAEVLMTERTAGELMDAGLMPLASLKEQDAALLVKFQTLALPPSPFLGIAGKSVQLDDAVSVIGMPEDVD